MSGSAILWLSSYLSEHQFSVAVGPFRLDTAAIQCGVPQGSMLAPALFALMLPLGQLIRNFPDIAYHC